MEIALILQEGDTRGLMRQEAEGEDSGGGRGDGGGGGEKDEEVMKLGERDAGEREEVKERF